MLQTHQANQDAPKSLVSSIRSIISCKFIRIIFIEYQNLNDMFVLNEVHHVLILFYINKLYRGLVR